MLDHLKREFYTGDSGICHHKNNAIRVGWSVRDLGASMAPKYWSMIMEMPWIWTSLSQSSDDTFYQVQKYR